MTSHLFNSIIFLSYIHFILQLLVFLSFFLLLLLFVFFLSLHFIHSITSQALSLVLCDPVLFSIAYCSSKFLPSTKFLLVVCGRVFFLGLGKGTNNSTHFSTMIFLAYLLQSLIFFVFNLSFYCSLLASLKCLSFNPPILFTISFFLSFTQVRTLTHFFIPFFPFFVTSHFT